MKIEQSVKLKWFVTITISVLFGVSTIFRVLNGQEADKSLCGVFIVMGGFVWGANLINVFKK